MNQVRKIKNVLGVFILGSLLSNSLHATQYFELSAWGIYKYMENLETEDKVAHQKLQVEADTIFSKAKKAYIVGGIGGLLGLGTMAAGMFIFDKEDKYGISENNDTMVYSGLGLLVVSGIYSIWTRPTKDDYMNFINKHNRVRPNSPLEINIIRINKTDSTGLAFNWSF